MSAKGDYVTISLLGKIVDVTSRGRLIVHVEGLTHGEQISSYDGDETVVVEPGRTAPAEPPPLSPIVRFSVAGAPDVECVIAAHDLGGLPIAVHATAPEWWIVGAEGDVARKGVLDRLLTAQVAARLGGKWSRRGEWECMRDETGPGFLVRSEWVRDAVGEPQRNV